MVALAVVLTVQPGAATRPTPLARAGLASLPAAALGPISEMLGRDSPTYAIHGLRAVNVPQRLLLAFSRRGVVVRSGAARLGIGLVAYGYAGSLRRVPAVAPRSTANRINYSTGPLTQWYANGPLGLEQGFSVSERPRSGSGALTFALSVSGGLTARIRHGSVRFAGRGVALRYGGLIATDARGRTLRSSLALARGGVMIRVDDHGAVYPLRIDPFVQQAQLTGSDSGLGAVAVSGTTIVAGGGNSQGAAYVFSEPASGWANATETKKLTASDGAANDRFGSSVAVSGNTVIVGAPGRNGGRGAAYVFVAPSATDWVDATQVAELTASDGAALDSLGYSVAVAGTTVVAGAPSRNFSAGAAYVFVKPGGGWATTSTFDAELESSLGNASGGCPGLGSSVAVSGTAPGTTVLAGQPSQASCNGGAVPGHAFVFVEPGGGWSATQPQLPAVGLTPAVSAAGDLFGNSVGISTSGDTAVVGAPFQTVGANTRQGAAYVFLKPSGGWAGSPARGELTAPDGAGGDAFGTSVAISSDAGTVAVDGTRQLGPAGSPPPVSYVFTVPGGGWTGTVDPPAELSTQHGSLPGPSSVALSGGTVVLGAFTPSFSGAAFVFATSIAIDITAPANGATYTQGQVVPAAYSCSSPTGATLTSCVGSVANGAAIDTSTLGAHTFTVTASDSTGNNVSQTSTYSVVLTTGPTPAPAVSASPSPLNQAAFVGQRSSQTLTITNSGNAPLGIFNSALTGAVSHNFTQSSDTCTGQTVAVGASCTLLITFIPFAAGAESAQITFTDNAPGSPHTVALSGTGVLGHLSGKVTHQGSPVSGSRVQLCSTSGNGCQLAVSSGSGDFAFVAPGGSYALSASAAQGEGTLSPIVIPSTLPGTVAGLDIALAIPPSVPSGVTVISPSFGSETASTSGPTVNYGEPNELVLARSLFPAGGTVVVTQVVLHGTNIDTGEPMTNVVDVGGSIAGTPIGAVVGSGPVSVTIPPVRPMHGQITSTLNYQFYPDGTYASTGVASTQELYEISPPTGGAQSTDPLPASFTNFGEPAGVTIGPGSITGADAQSFSIVPHGVPNTTDCGSSGADLRQWDQSSASPPPSTRCALEVQFTPPAASPNQKLFYHSTLEVATHRGGLAGRIAVTLIGCDQRVASQAAAVTGFDACGGDQTAGGGGPVPPGFSNGLLRYPPAASLVPGLFTGQNPIVPIGGLYVDPSGTVRANSGHGAPFALPGATVTLQASPRATGPFRPVPNHSLVMSPANRRNPDRTSGLGSFGWDVLAGFYRVAAQHSGCTAVHSRGRVTQTKVLTVPPAAINLNLTLRCPHLRRTPTRVSLSVTRVRRGRRGPAQITLAARVHVHRGRHPLGLVSFLAGRRVLALVPVDPRRATARLTINVRRAQRYAAQYQGDGYHAPSRRASAG